MEIKMFYIRFVNDSLPHDDKILAIQKDIQSGMCMADVDEKYDDWEITDEAYLDLAIKCGWNPAQTLAELEKHYEDAMTEIYNAARMELVNEAAEYFKAHNEGDKNMSYDILRRFCDEDYDVCLFAVNKAWRDLIWCLLFQCDSCAW